MKIFNDPHALPPESRGGVLALGNFDGVHLGHQDILAKTRSLAQKAGKAAGVLTFEPHPRQLFRPEQPLFRITGAEEKLELLAACGMDFAVVLTFDATLAAMTAEDFIARILGDRLGVTHAVAGFNFHFGKGRKGTSQLLKDQGAALGIGVTILEPAGTGGTVYSSSAVRTLLAGGDVEGAAQLLGYRWFVRAAIIQGDQRGRTLGYPTANMALDPQVDLAHGIYAVRIRLAGEAGTGERLHDGVASFGVRPTFGGGRPLLETFIFDFSGDLYGEVAEVEFIGRIRGEEKFDSIEALITRMDEDSRKARQMLADASARPLDFTIARSRRGQARLTAQ